MKSPFGSNCQALCDVDKQYKNLSLKLFLQRMSPYFFTEQHKELLVHIMEKCIGDGH